MVESYALIFADTISLDSRYRWCQYIYVLSVNLRVPGPLTALSFLTGPYSSVVSAHCVDKIKYK